jgi:O-antigen ligase
MTTSLGDSTGPFYGRPEVGPVGPIEHLGALWARHVGDNRQRMLVGVTVYAMWALLLVRAIFGGQTSRAVLLLLPLVLLAANARPRLALLASIPAATFGTVVLSSWLSFRAYALVVAGAGLGVVTRRWRVLPVFHATVGLLALTVVGSAFTNAAFAGTLSVRTPALYTAMGLAVMASAAMIRPRIDHVLLVIAATGAAVGWVVLVGWFRIDELTRPGALLRVFALGLNPNYLGVLVALGALAAVGLAVERRVWWFALLAVPCVLAMPNLKSRTALALLAVGLVAIVVSLPGRRRRRLAVGVGVLALVLLLDTSVVDDIYRSVLGARADLDLSGTDEFRRGVAVYAWEQGLDHPLAGLGYGQFPVVAGARFPIVNPSAHNEYLRYFAELGVVGLGLLVALVVQVGRAVRRVPLRTTSTVVLGMYVLAMFTMEPLQSLPTSMGVLVLAGAVVGWAHADTPAHAGAVPAALADGAADRTAGAGPGAAAGAGPGTAARAGAGGGAEATVPTEIDPTWPGVRGRGLLRERVDRKGHRS